MSTSRQRLWEISDLLVDVSKAIDTLVSGDPYVDLRIWSEKAAELKHYASDLVSISGAVRQQEENMAVMQGQLNHLSPGPCKNGMIVDGKLINTEAENANRDDFVRDDSLEDWERFSMIQDRLEAIEKMLFSGIAVDIPALEIDAMSESEIDEASDDAIIERAEKAIRKKVN